MMALMEEFDSLSEEYLINQTELISPPSPPIYFPWNLSKSHHNFDSYVSNMRLKIGQVIQCLELLAIITRKSNGKRVSLKKLMVLSNVFNRNVEAIRENTYFVLRSLEDKETDFLLSENNVCVSSLAVDESTNSISMGKSQQNFRGQMYTIDFGNEDRNANCASRYSDQDENDNFYLPSLIRIFRTDNSKGKGQKIMYMQKKELSFVSRISTLRKSANQIGGPHFNNTKTPTCEQNPPTVFTSPIQEKEIFLTRNHDTGNNCLTNDSIMINELTDFHIDINVESPHFLLENQPSAARQSFETEKDDLESMMENVSLIGQLAHYSHDSNEFVDWGSYYQGLEVEGNDAILHSEVEIGGKGKKEISREAIEACMSTGMTLVTSANKLGVSRSTLKRRCRDLGISEWRSNKRMIQDLSNQNNLTNKSTFMSQSPELKLGDPDNSGSTSSKRKRMNVINFKNKPDYTFKKKLAQKKLNTLSKAGNREQEENTELELAPYHVSSKAIQEGTSNMFTIKAKYKQDIIKFKFSRKSGYGQLKEEVGSRLNLDFNKFKITYIDKDSDYVLITSDSDLELFLHNLELSKFEQVRLFIVEKS